MINPINQLVNQSIFSNLHNNLLWLRELVSSVSNSIPLDLLVLV
nr:MAG TPA: hypothetical protein [Caudoviricetes sp.]